MDSGEQAQSELEDAQECICASSAVERGHVNGKRELMNRIPSSSEKHTTSEQVRVVSDCVLEQKSF